MTNPDWTFEIPGLLGTGGVLRQTQTVAPGDTTYVPPDWYLKAVMLNGKDITDTPLDFEKGGDLSGVQVVVTLKRTEISGGVVDAQGAAVGDYATVIFPEDRTQWTLFSRFVTAGRPDQTGQFKILGLPCWDACSIKRRS